MKFSSETPSDRVVALLLVVFGVLFRLAPHPDNFTPTMAIALFSGVTLPPALALTVPLLVMMATDLVIGIHSLFWLVWGSFAAVVLIGLWVGRDAGAGRVVTGVLSGSVFFFIATNLGVFLFEGMYPKNLEGLAQCYTMAVPFFRNSLAGDIFYTFSFFAAFSAAQWTRQPKRIS